MKKLLFVIMPILLINTFCSSLQAQMAEEEEVHFTFPDAPQPSVWEVISDKAQEIKRWIKEHPFQAATLGIGAFGLGYLEKARRRYKKFQQLQKDYRITLRYDSFNLGDKNVYKSDVAAALEVYGPSSGINWYLGGAREEMADVKNQISTTYKPRKFAYATLENIVSDTNLWRILADNKSKDAKLTTSDATSLANHLKNQYWLKKADIKDIFDEFKGDSKNAARGYRTFDNWKKAVETEIDAYNSELQQYHQFLINQAKK